MCCTCLGQAWRRLWDRMGEHPYGKERYCSEFASTVLLPSTLQDGMNAQELNGLWGRKTIVCSSGIFEPNNYTQWRTWRNSLPDNQIGGYM